MTDFREIKIPGDKSISHRAIMLSSLSEDIVKIENILLSEDVKMTIDAFRSMGVKIDLDNKNNEVTVYGVGLRGLSKPEKPLYMGNSGTTMRLMAGLLSAQNFDSILTGDASLNKRPMKRVIEPVSLMGGTIESKNEGNTGPLYIYGNKNLKAIRYEMKVASAQVKSAILLASLYTNMESEIIEESKSRDHTENMIKYFNECNWRVDKLYIPSDISSASYFIVYGLLKENIYMKNVGINPTRTGIIDLLKSIGGKIQIKNIRYENNEKIGDIYVYKSKLEAFNIGGDLVVRLIDEIPILSVLAALIDGESKIEDAKELRVKETDRINGICRNLEKLGVSLVEKKDGMSIRGGEKFIDTKLSSYGDHRIAMAFEIFLKVTGNKSLIDEKESVKISFPDFYRELGF